MLIIASWLDGRLLLSVMYSDWDWPHFWISKENDVALVRLEGLILEMGKIPKEELELALSWAVQNLHLIKSAWDRLNGGFGQGS